MIAADFRSRPVPQTRPHRISPPANLVMPKFGFDDWMDAQLRQVPLPRTLLARLRNNTGPSAADEKMGILLRNVAVPIDLESRLMQIAQAPSFSWYRASVAAAVFFVV